MITFDKITKKYDQHLVVSDISFEIQKGEMVVLIGESGCGKTTLLKIINRLVKPSSGNVYINGENILKKDVIELRRNIGYVIQQTGLFPHMTVRENIEIIPRLQKKKDKTHILNKTIELMEMVGLKPEQYLERYPFQLSGGQQQRVGVARAFACDPDVILMDEPFSALDPITRVQLQDELVELQSKLKKTIVFVTHDMDEAVKIADKICLIDKGRIVQYDTVEEIMKNPANEFVSEFMGANRIWSSPEYIKARDIMIKNPVCVSPDTTVLRSMERMRFQKVDSLLVTDKEKHLLGLIRAKTIQEKVQMDKNIAVSEIMQSDIEKISPEDNIVMILDIFNMHNLSAVPVVDENNVLQGLITKSSLLTTLSQQYLDTPEVM